MKAKDLEDLINKKTKLNLEKKEQQIKKLILILRNQSLASLVACDVIFAGVVLYRFDLALFFCIAAGIFIKIASSIFDMRRSKMK